MIRSFLSYWDLRKNRFAHALAHRKERHDKSGDTLAWIYYRLQMYESAVNTSCSGRGWRCLFARAVSLAACGRHDEAAAIVRQMMERGRGSEHFIALADALAPFMPELSLALIHNIIAPASLRSALLLRVGQADQAHRVISDAFVRGEERRSPELFLYRSNAFRERSPSEQMEDLNAFLSQYGVPPLALKDPGLPPSPINVEAAEPFPSAEGPLVTILMTTYRTHHRADVAIASILGQSYGNIELIVVDDASGDDTPEIIRQWAERDDRVHFIPLPRNVGTYVAKNIGLLRARGEFVTCHDSDDWSHPLKIERQVRPLIDNPRLIATTSHWVRMQDDGLYYARPVHPLMRINPSSPLFRREKVMRDAGIWDCVRTGADSEFLARLRVVFGKHAIKRIVQPLALGSHRVDSLMTAHSTGYSEMGVSPQRLAYWEAWNAWHVRELRSGRTPFIPPDILANRRFEVPGEIVVPNEARRQVLM